MQTLKLRVSVRDHRIAAELPPEVPDGDAELVLHYQEIAPGSLERARRRHLQELFARIRRHSPNRSREDIDRRVAEERASWGE